MRKITIIISISLFLSSCYKETDYHYTADEIFEQLTVSFSNDSLPADLSSITVMTIKMPIASDTNLTKFDLSCGKCVFLDSESNKLTTNISMVGEDEEHRYVEVPIRASNSIGNATVTMELSGYEKTETFRLFKAQATEISLSSSVDYVLNDTITEIPLSAVVKSATGLASRGVNVAFSAVYSPPYSGSNGFFFEEDSVGINGSSIAGNTFLFQGDGQYVGDITLTASTAGIGGGDITIHVIN